MRKRGDTLRREKVLTAVHSFVAERLGSWVCEAVLTSSTDAFIHISHLLGSVV